MLEPDFTEVITLVVDIGVLELQNVRVAKRRKLNSLNSNLNLTSCSENKICQQFITIYHEDNKIYILNAQHRDLYKSSWSSCGGAPTLKKFLKLVQYK